MTEVEELMTYDKTINLEVVATYDEHGKCVGVYLPADMQGLLTALEQAGSHWWFDTDTHQWIEGPTND